ncbi:hypothetical protein [Intrasporangium oryzae]|uniref:hypothetical protein n=1 Tax=Intrasporangium oryzae TaxID=412687 RepID=UPI002ADE2085|nr:hypothetical protein [Intrasporangium oryzae]
MGEQPANPTKPDIARLGPAGWLGWGGLVLTALLGAASSGVGGFFGMAATYVLSVGIIALVRGHVHWAHLRGRAAGGVALGAAFALFMVAAATAGPTPPAPVTTADASSSTIPTPTTTSAPSTTATNTTTAPAATTSTVSQDAADGTALAALAQLPIKGRAPKTGYTRAEFGQAWADVNRNGCDTATTSCAGT